TFPVASGQVVHARGLFLVEMELEHVVGRGRSEILAVSDHAAEGADLVRGVVLARGLGKCHGGSSRGNFSKKYATGQGRRRSHGRRAESVSRFSGGRGKRGPVVQRALGKTGRQPDRYFSEPLLFWFSKIQVWARSATLANSGRSSRPKLVESFHCSPS